MGAKVTIGKGNEEFMHLLASLEKGAEGIGKMAVYDAAGITADEVRKSLSAVLENSTRSTSDLGKSLGIAKIKVFKDVTTNVSFDGYDRKGVPNILKARALESGTSRGQPKRPFFRKAVNAARQTAIGAMESVVDREIKKRAK
jgi:hypothetical protein